MITKVKMLLFPETWLKVSRESDLPSPLFLVNSNKNINFGIIKWEMLNMWV